MTIESGISQNTNEKKSDDVKVDVVDQSGEKQEESKNKPSRLQEAAFLTLRFASDVSIGLFVSAMTTTTAAKQPINNITSFMLIDTATLTYRLMAEHVRAPTSYYIKRGLADSAIVFGLSAVGYWMGQFATSTTPPDFSEETDPYLGQSLGARALAGTVGLAISIPLRYLFISHLKHPERKPENEQMSPQAKTVLKEIGLVIKTVAATDVFGQLIVAVQGPNALNTYFPLISLPTYLGFKGLTYFANTAEPIKTLTEEYVKNCLESADNKNNGLMQQNMVVTHPTAKAILNEIKLGTVLLVAGAAVGGVSAQCFTDEQERHTGYQVAGTIITLGAGMLAVQAVKSKDFIWAKVSAVSSALFARFKGAEDKVSPAPTERTGLVKN